MTRRAINWPWRILTLVLIGPATAVATGLAIQHGHPELVGQQVTDQGVPVVTWRHIPDSADVANQWFIWCRAVDRGAPNDPQLDAHTDQLRQGDMYAEHCTPARDGR